MTDALTRLMPMLVITGIGLLVFAGLALWQLGRSTRRLADSEARAWQLAYQDPLTGLPTYARLLDLIANALADRKADEIVALALIDIVGFREINDTLGHAGTDELLATLAQRLKAALPNHIVADGPARDEFSVLIAASDGAAVKTALDGAVEALSRQYWINQAVEINFVIGRAQVPGDAATPDELTRRANLALHSASRKSRWHIAAFRPDMEKDFHERTFITRELRRALAGDMLDVHYQPIVTANGAVIAGVEALLRWNHAARGAIPPSVFVPVAEQTGLMQELGSFILRRALRDAMRWPNIYVSVNLSPVQVRDPAFVRVAADAIAESGIEPGRVVLEITEGVLIETPEESKASLEVLRGLGIKLALDDFGSGYSNLGYLQKYPIDKIKIDKSFVDPLGGPAIGGAIIQAIVALGRALGLQVCAEGVETEQQRVLLRLAGCDEMQGFLFSKPVPRNEIDRLLAARPARAALSA